MVIDSVAYSVDDSNFYYDVTISNVPSNTAMEFKFSQPGPGGSFDPGNKEELYVVFETNGGTLTAPATMATTFSRPPLDRWLDRIGIDVTIVSGGVGVWRIFGSRPHGVNPFVPGDTVFNTAIRGADFFVIQEANTPVTTVGAPITYSVGGSVTGLSGTVTLQNNDTDDLDISANGVFNFATKLSDTSAYAVSVSAQPTGQNCTVTGGDNSLGGGNIAAADVSDVLVTCVDDVTPPPAAVTSYTGTLPSGATGTLSFTSADAGCTFATPPQFLDTVTPAPPASVFLVDGVLSFSITGCTPGASVTLSMDYGSALPIGANYWKAGTPWYRLPASISGSIVTFSITDGGLGDTDGAVNGTIIDPGGVATSTVTGTSSGPATPVPTMPIYGLILTILGLLFVARRRMNTGTRKG